MCPREYLIKMYNIEEQWFIGNHKFIILMADEIVSFSSKQYTLQEQVDLKSLLTLNYVDRNYMKEHMEVTFSLIDYHILLHIDVHRDRGLFTDLID